MQLLRLNLKVLLWKFPASKTNIPCEYAPVACEWLGTRRLIRRKKWVAILHNSYYI